MFGRKIGRYCCVVRMLDVELEGLRRDVICEMRCMLEIMFYHDDGF